MTRSLSGLKNSTLADLSRWAVMSGLVVLLPFLRLPFLIAGVALVGLHLGLRAERQAAHELFIALANTVGLPFLAGSIWPGDGPAMWLVPLLVIPGLPWVESALRRARDSLVQGYVRPISRELPVRLPGGKWMTPYALALGAGLLAQTLIGALAQDVVLAGTGLILLSLFGLLVAISYLRIPTAFLMVQAPTVRILANNSSEVEIPLKSTARTPIGVLLEESEIWTTIREKSLFLNSEGIHARIRFTPPLAGPSRISARATAIDPWGLTATRQSVDLVHLRVIPRAAYAAWLAQRYLRQMQSGGLAMFALSESTRAGQVRRGLDYYGARLYEPGDVLRDIFWKHTLKLNQYIVKERRDEYGEAVVMAVNCIAGNPEDADWLAYHILMSTLVLAREGIPVTFAAYSSEDVREVTRALSPRAAIVHALRLIGSIRIEPQPIRVLQPAQLGRLKRNISRLRTGGSEPAIRLAGILNYEYQAVLLRAQSHPATRALRRVFADPVPPTAALVVSVLDDDNEALEYVLERVRRKGVHRLQFIPARPRPLTSTAN